MDGFLRQSTAVTVKIGPFTDDTDGATLETGLTISQADVRLSKVGGSYAQKNESSACSHDENGEYDCALNATDTNTVGILKLLVKESGALVVWHSYMVIPANAYDSLVAGTDYLQGDVVQWLGQAVTADSNVPEVHVVDMDDGVITAAKIATDAITSDEIATSAAQEIADATLIRGVSNVEDSADTTSLAGVILAIFESEVDGVTWTIRKTGGTVFVTKTLTTDVNAAPIVGVT